MHAGLVKQSCRVVEAPTTLFTGFPIRFSIYQARKERSTYLCERQVKQLHNGPLAALKRDLVSEDFGKIFVLIFLSDPPQELSAA